MNFRKIGERFFKKGYKIKKTPWEKEKLLVTSNFSFSHGVFNCWLVVLGFNATLTAMVISWRTYVSWLSHTSTNTTFLSKPTDYFSCRGERRKYAGNKSRLNRGSNSQPPGHESDTLTTEPPGRGTVFSKDLYC